MKNLITLIAFSAWLMAMCMPISSHAQVDTLSINQLDEYLSKAKGNVRIYLKDWVEYNKDLAADGDSIYYVEDRNFAQISSLLGNQYTYENDTVYSVFNKYPTPRVELELAETSAENIYGGMIEGKALASVKFPDNIKIFGVTYEQFGTKLEAPLARIQISNCQNLKKIVLPKKLEYLGGIDNCPSLEELEVPEGTLYFGGVMDCKSLKTIKLPKSLKYASNISMCPSLASVNLPESIIEGDALPDIYLSGCTSLESVTLPKNITRLGEYSFDDFDTRTIEYGYLPFANCKSLKSIEIPEGVEIIGASAFWGCTSLQSVKLPSSLKKIANHAFANCASLQEIVLPEGLKVIGSFAFEGCGNLKKINIPAGVDSIGNGVFWACKALKNGSDPNKITVGGHEMDYWDNEITCDMFGSEIPVSAFNGFSSLQSVTIPDNVARIDAEAFYNCASLSKVKFHDGISFNFDGNEDYEHYSPFGGCINLKTVDFGKNIKNLDGFGGWYYAETIIIRDDKLQECEALWGSGIKVTIEDLEGKEVTKLVYSSANTNYHCTIYVKKNLIPKYQKYMAKINKKYDLREKLNYKFLPLESYKN